MLSSKHFYLKIHQLHLYFYTILIICNYNLSKNTPIASLLRRVFWYDTKQSAGEASVMLELWGMQSTPLLPSIPGPLCPELVVQSMDQTELSDISSK